MSRQVELQVRLELLSDTIFGSGHSIPGGEDIAVCQDENGYPYLKGTTFKGLLRESMHDLLEWSGGPTDTVEALLGKEGWTGTAGGRRLHLTPLTLEEKPEESETCYDHRTFTSLENDVVKTGTLRSAMCICRGQKFIGKIFCEEQDVPFVRESARGIKWLGTMRSRGFGHVKVIAEPVKAQKAAFPAVGATHCLHYTLYTETPVSMTDYNRSGENSWDTHGYIAGAAVRGMAASLLAQREPDWFAANKIALLTEKTRFLSAFPVQNDNPAVLPSLKGFYEQKDGSDFRSVLENGTDKDGNKEIEAGKDVTIVDTVTLEGLEIGTKYQLVGWQMLKEENAELIIDGKRIENDYTFIADKESMKVEIAFTFDASSLGGKQLVTFEELYDVSNPDEPKKVTEHKDIEDDGQTVTIKEVPETPEEPKEPEKPETPQTPDTPKKTDSPKTGDSTNLYGLLALLLTSGAGLAGTYLYKRRKVKKS